MQNSNKKNLFGIIKKIIYRLKGKGRVRSSITSSSSTSAKSKHKPISTKPEAMHDNSQITIIPTDETDVGDVSRSNQVTQLSYSDKQGSPVFLSSKKRQEKRSLVNFGIDFGTSSSKVFLREVISGNTYAYAFKKPIEAYGPFCWPSTIRIFEGRIYFGIPAENMEQGRAIRSFKICLACKNGFVSKRECSLKTCLINNGNLGSFALDFGKGISVCLKPWELASLYIANLLNEVVSEVFNHDSFGQNTKCTFNMSAPLDMVNIESMKMTFEKVLYIANLIKDKICQGIEVEKAITILDCFKRDFIKLPKEDEKHTFIIPETHAAMVGYVVSGKAEPGLYAAIDIGAGTTDVAIFRYCDKHAVKDVAYYMADTDLVGGDNMDISIMKLVIEGDNEITETKMKLLSYIRHSKRNFDETDGLFLYNKRYDSHSIVAATKSDLDRIYSHYRKTWGKGYQKEMRPDHWKDLNILLLGGCNKLSFVNRRFSQDNPSRDFLGIIKKLQLHPIHLPTDIKVFGSINNTDLSEYVSILILAYGLSFHIAQNPEYFKPHEVEPLPKRNQIKKDSSFEGHWW